MISSGSIKTSSATESVKFSSTFSVFVFFLGDVRRARGGFLFGSSLKLFQECKTGLAPSSKRIHVPQEVYITYVLRNASHKVLCSLQPRSHLCYCVSLQDYTTNLLFFAEQAKRRGAFLPLMCVNISLYLGVQPRFHDGSLSFSFFVFFLR